MVGDRLSMVLQEFGNLVGMSDLQADENNSCLLRIPNGIEVQIEADKAQDHLIIGIDLGEVPPGAYRARIFRSAMITNGLPPPRYGVLAYSKQIDHMVLFDRLAMKGLTAGTIASSLEMLIPKAVIWRDAIARGEVPEGTVKGGPQELGGLFGLKH